MWEHALDGNVHDLIGECIAGVDQRLGGMELFLGGIGEDRNIAINKPGELTGPGLTILGLGG